MPALTTQVPISLPAHRADAVRASEAYWLEKLAGDLPIAALPGDIVAGPEAATPRTARLQYSMRSSTARALQRAAGGRATLAFVPLVAALKILLHVYSELEDVIVGTTIHTRHAETADLNQVLALRDRVTRDETVRAVLASVQRTLADAYTHQKYPFDRLVQRLRPGAPGARLFAVSVLLDGINDPRHLRSTSCELTSVWRLTPEQAELQVSYDAGRFEPRTIEIFARQYCDLVAGVLACPDARIADLDLCPAAARERLVVAFNATMSPIDETPIVRAIERQVARTPGAPAVEDGETILTYAELDARGTRFASALHARGLGRGSVVALAMERSADAIVAMLAVLEIGATYLPIDPRCPAKRAAFMLDDARVAAIVTDRAALSRWAGAARPVLCVDTVATATPETSRPALASPSADDVAYILYTSGSTGWPKGVAVPHRALSNYLTWAARTYARDAPADMALHTSLAVDLTVTSIFVPLLTGGRVVVYTSHAYLPAIFDVVREDQVDLLKVTPSHLALVRDHDFSRSRVRCLIVGGEALATHLAREVQRRGGDHLEIYNEYGPTEATVGCTAHRFNPETDKGLHVPIGRPIANAQVYVLDRRLRPVADGMRGDIAVGGCGLARGYVGRDDLTAERFVDHPFAPGQRLYLTGDVGRHLPGGGLEYLGRRDDQVKTHGVRLQLEEVRHLLNRHPDVSDSAARLVADETTGTEMLVAYYVSGREIPSATLRGFLAETMSEGTLPTLFVQLPSLPLTPSGKLDVRALPAPADLTSRITRDELRTPTEEILAGIWAHVLCATEVGIADNFFAIGGHSLLATRIVSRIREVFGVELPLRAFFEGPTVAELAAHVEALRRAAFPILPPVVPAARTGAMPLSFAQEGLWFLDRLQPGSTSYNCGSVLRLKGTIDAAVLARALREIVRRHEVLRTILVDVDGTPASVVTRAAGIALPMTDLSALGPARGAETRRQASADMARPFDLATGPLLRTRLLRLGVDEHVLLLTTHHVVSDEWSTAILLRELSALYAAYREGRASPLPELPVQYADYAAWQRAHLQGDVLDRQLAYWKEHLAGIPEVLPLPTDHPRPAVRTHRGAQERFEVRQDVLERLHAMGRRDGLTLYLLALGAFQVLLSKYSASTDIVTGTWIAGRARPEVEGLIGFFINVLVLRTDLSGDPSFRAIMRRVRETVLGAFEHQDVPFERLVEALQPDRRLSHSPLFQVSFTLTAVRESSDALTGLSVGGVDVQVDSAKFDLEMNLTATSRGLIGALTYSTDLFERATIVRLVRHFTTLLEGLVAEPDRAIGEVTCVPADEQEWLRRMGTGPALDVVEPGISRLIVDQVARTPDAVAVVAGDRHLGYATLLDGVNRLSQRLRGLGVRCETPVAVGVDRSVDLPVALLGVLQAGGAYVPLDPGFPRERLARMLEDSRAPVLLTQRGLLDHLPLTDTAVVYMDDERGRVDEVRLPPPLASSLHPAYIIFTSGSTGRPKGTIVSHRALANALQSMAIDPGLTQDDRVLAITTLSFDIAALELFMPLIVGATVVIADRAVVQVPTALAAAVEREAITVMQATPTTWQALFDSGWHGAGRLRALCGGEALPPALAARLHAACAAVTNMYGPTETTIWSTVGRLTTTVPALGHPIANTTIRVLDGDGELAPMGVPGELGIAGEGLARGYVGRAGLTAARFVPDAHGGPGTRVYRTGDRVRWRADGALEFLGRFDAQVKVRGYRIELGEVEAVLASQPGVGRCVVVRREDESGDSRLVAYVVAEASSPEDAVWRAALAEQLPDCMVPGVFVRRDALPLTLNGKVDRAALPAPRPEDTSGRIYTARPRDSIETMLKQIWEEVLARSDVGIRDNFFALGGHSLTAVKLSVALSARSGKNVAVRAIFDHPTIAEQAALMRQEITLSPPGSVVAVQPRGERLPLFCVHPAGGLVHSFVDLARHLGSAQPVYAFQSRGLEDEQSPLTSIEAMAALYVRDMRRVQSHGPYRIGGLSFGTVVAFEMARQLHAAGAPVSTLVLMDGGFAGTTEDFFADGWEHALAEWEAKYIVSMAESELGIPPAEMQPLDRERQLARYLDGAKDQDRVPRDVTPAQFERLLRVFATNVRALHAYRPRPYAGSAVLFRSAVSERTDHTFGWSSVCQSGVEVYVLPGGHGELVAEPVVAEFSALLGSVLARDVADVSVSLA